MKLSRTLTIAACFCAFISHATAQVPQAFDVSSMKENKSGIEAFSIPTNTHGTFVGRNMTLMLLITTAYRVQNVQVIGGPSWINTARFDIDAKGPDTAETAPEVYAMVRTLLANRFKLVIRNETRELPVYALVVAKGGPISWQHEVWSQFVYPADADEYCHVGKIVTAEQAITALRKDVKN